MSPAPYIFLAVILFVIGAIGSLTWRRRIAIGASESWNGTLPVNSSKAMQPTE